MAKTPLSEQSCTPRLGRKMAAFFSVRWQALLYNRAWQDKKVCKGQSMGHIDQSIDQSIDHASAAPDSFCCALRHATETKRDLF